MRTFKSHHKKLKSMHLLGFVINPIAGMGGRVGLKGTDDVVEEAIKRGAEPISGQRALEMLKSLRRAQKVLKRVLPIQWVTVSGAMGADVLREAGFSPGEYRVVHECGEKTTREDTRKACSRFREEGVELIVFCGGDGTARDVHDVVRTSVPILGIPSGVKMHSGVFGINPDSVAEVIMAFLEGNLELGEVEIMDLDEEQYRKGIWSIKLHGIAYTPFERNYIQSAKVIIEGPSEKEIKEEISEYITEEMEEDTLYILGPGSTLKAIGDHLHIDKTLLGIDAVYNTVLMAKDATEKDLLSLLKQYPSVKLVVSPIGAQGFILGRGNLQLSPEVIRKIGIDNILVVASPSKLRHMDVLRIDTQDRALDEAFLKKNHLRVIVGYHTMAVRKVEVPTHI
jgi:predicted polyphosphate/ATP-dependent NAD kinase